MPSKVKVKPDNKKTFIVEAYELFGYKTSYTVQAETAEEAERLCRAGEVSYDEKEETENDQWVETISVETLNEPDHYEPIEEEEEEEEEEEDGGA